MHIPFQFKDRRKGRNVTLHEYCSTSVDDMIHRHLYVSLVEISFVSSNSRINSILQFDGHKELKGAVDFGDQVDSGAEVSVNGPGFPQVWPSALQRRKSS